MNAEAISRKLTFLPDSTIGLAEFYNTKDSIGVEFPEVAAEIAEISFKPRQKVLTVKTHRDNFISLFGNQCYLKGKLFSENGLDGSGSCNLLDASMFAEEYTFSSTELFSDSSSFNLRNRFAKAGENPLAIQSDGLKSYISFEKRIGNLIQVVPNVLNFQAIIITVRWISFSGRWMESRLISKKTKMPKQNLRVVKV